MVSIHQVGPTLVYGQQIAQHLAVVHVGRSGDDRVDQLAVAVGADVCHHAEVPLVAFLGLAHFRVALLVLVLGGARRGDQGGIDDGAAADAKAVFLQVLLHQFEQARAQVARFQQMAELADGGFVRHRLAAEIDAGETAYGARVVQGFLDRRIGQVEPVLQEMNPQHALDADRPAARAFGVGIERFDGRRQFRPRNDLVHVFQKLLAAGFLAVLLEAFFGKRSLVSSDTQSCAWAVPVSFRCDKCDYRKCRELIRVSLRQLKQLVKESLA